MVSQIIVFLTFLMTGLSIEEDGFFLLLPTSVDGQPEQLQTQVITVTLEIPSLSDDDLNNLENLFNVLHNHTLIYEINSTVAKNYLSDFISTINNIKYIFSETSSLKNYSFPPTGNIPQCTYKYNHENYIAEYIFMSGKLIQMSDYLAASVEDDIDYQLSNQYATAISLLENGINKLHNLLIMLDDHYKILSNLLFKHQLQNIVFKDITLTDNRLCKEIDTSNVLADSILVKDCYSTKTTLKCLLSLKTFSSFSEIQSYFNIPYNRISLNNTFLTNMMTKKMTINRCEDTTPLKCHKLEDNRSLNCLKSVQTKNITNVILHCDKHQIISNFHHFDDNSILFFDTLDKEQITSDNIEIINDLKTMTFPTLYSYSGELTINEKGNPISFINENLVNKITQSQLSEIEITEFSELEQDLYDMIQDHFSESSLIYTLLIFTISVMGMALAYGKHILTKVKSSKLRHNIELSKFLKPNFNQRFR